MVVVREGEMNWEGEVESALQQSELQEAKQSHIINDVPFSTSATPSSLSLLGRQSSIYSLTLDEFQHSLCESGKNFGSMNMDEFLSSIWNAEENQQQQQQAATNNNTNNHNNLSLTKQPSLNRQTSLSIPAPLCRKTVDQVWSEIHKQQQQNNNNNNTNVVRNTECATRQPTFGEMTLEDFLVKAGVVRETVAPSHQQQHYAVYNPSNNSTMAPGAATAPFVIGGGGGGNVVTVGDPSGSGYAGNGGNKRDGLGTGYPAPAAVAAGVCYGGGRVVNGGGGGGYGVAVAPVTMGMGRPLSPVSSDGMGNENSGGGQFGLDMSGFRGRKRIVDGPVERVVERRQRRMIKNRESAARSRARKQAYTVELEAELNQLREENAQLKQALAELERRRRQQCLEEVNVRVQTKAQKAKEKLRALRRNMSCPL